MGPSTYNYINVFILINAPYYWKVNCSKWLRSCASNDTLIIIHAYYLYQIHHSLIVITCAS